MVKTSSTTLRDDIGAHLNEREARRILEAARADFYRATADLDAAREQLLTTYRQVQPIIDRTSA